MKTNWKAIAIMFIILFCAESVILIWAVTTGMSDIAKEEECIMDVCEGDHAYQYYPSTNMCYCYNEYGERIKEQSIK